jgi:membrane-bound lytic murein transglycosylase B
MFTPFRFLQVIAVTIALGGCATQKTAAVPGQDTGASAPQAATSPALPAELPSIRSGTSLANGGPLQQADGSLDPDIQAYAKEVASVRQVPLPHVEALLRSANYNATAVRLMQPSPHRIRRSWTTYRKRFVEPVRIRAGQQFWQDNQAFLDATAKEYGVPQSIIVAIIGVETIYGRNTGSFRVLDALATLGFRYPDDSRPERGQLFRDQLADLIQLDYLGQLDASSVTGSYAGAIGLPQFMPGSLARFAADGDGDGHIDVSGSTRDAIASVARFLRLHGWEPGLPVFARATLPRNPQSLVHGGLAPTLDWPELAAQGAAVIGPADPPPAWTRHKLGVVDLVDESQNRAEYRLGTPNFFAITHYNRSYFYASSVADLALALAGKMGYGWP